MRVPEPLPERLPGAAHAVVTRDKVLRYLLDPGHDTGAHKARRFRAVLGYTRADAERLREDLAAAVMVGRVVSCRPGPFGGLTFGVVLRLTGPNECSADVRSNWRVLAPGAAPRLTSAWPERSSRPEGGG